MYLLDLCRLDVQCTTDTSSYTVKTCLTLIHQFVQLLHHTSKYVLIYIYHPSTCPFLGVFEKVLQSCDVLGQMLLSLYEMDTFNPAPPGVPNVHSLATFCKPQSHTRHLGYPLVKYHRSASWTKRMQILHKYHLAITVPCQNWQKLWEILLSPVFLYIVAHQYQFQC